MNASSHVFFHTTSGPVSNADLITIAALVSTQWNTNLAADTPNTTILRQVEAEDLGNPSTVPGLWSGSRPGSYPTTGQSAEVATLVNFVIARRYRGGKPRVYLPMGVSAQLSSPVQWQSTYTSAVTAHWANFQTAIRSGSPSSATLDKQVNVSYYAHHALRGSPVVDDILSASASPIPASQRRRMGR
jgi:hypothetical protein